METLDVAAVKKELIDNHHIPEEEIVIATGEERGLEQLEKDYEGGILSSKCPVRFVHHPAGAGGRLGLRQRLHSRQHGGVKSSTAVEQLLGRILRQPQARRSGRHRP